MKTYDAYYLRFNTFGGLKNKLELGWARLGLETEGTETLGLVSVLYKILELVLSRSRLVCFRFTQSRLGLVLTRMCSYQRN